MNVRVNVLDTAPPSHVAAIEEAYRVVASQHRLADQRWEILVEAGEADGLFLGGDIDEQTTAELAYVLREARRRVERPLPEDIYVIELFHKADPFAPGFFEAPADAWLVCGGPEASVEVSSPEARDAEVARRRDHVIDIERQHSDVQSTNLLHVHVFGVNSEARRRVGVPTQSQGMIFYEIVEGPSTADLFLKDIKERFAKRLTHCQIYNKAEGRSDKGFTIVAPDGSRLLFTESDRAPDWGQQCHNFPNEFPSALQAWSMCCDWLAGVCQSPIPESMSSFLQALRIGDGETWTPNAVIFRQYLDHCERAGVQPESRAKFWNRVKSHFLVSGEHLEFRRILGPKRRIVKASEIAVHTPALEALHLNATLPTAPIPARRSRM